MPRANKDFTLRHHPGHGRRAAVAVIGCVLSAGALAGCGDFDDDSGSSPTPTRAIRSPDEASFSGLPPSALASRAASAIVPARASASAAASSAAARASEDEASVDARH
ncbi:hypothetical protein ABZ202_12400 [Streptomyces sp. NPDC006186]|uniref:hypothetical protein n=1 Tax=Streptomyces sp. NPDC006186 TaxID=3155248 RepID=UPI0033A7D008